MLQVFAALIASCLSAKYFLSCFVANFNAMNPTATDAMTADDLSLSNVFFDTVTLRGRWGLAI